MTQSVWTHRASDPSGRNASVRRRAQTLRKPVIRVETDSVMPSGTGCRIPSSAARTTQARPRDVYHSRSKPSCSLWIQATSWA